MESNINYNESNLETMARMPDCFLDLTVTSPPYDNIRDYKGFSFDMELLSSELYRVTKEGGIVVWIVADQTINGSETGTSFRHALRFMECGFNLHDTMIFQKAGFPFPMKTRYNSVFEYMFVFSKGKPKTCNLIEDKLNKFSGKKVAKRTGERQKNGDLKENSAFRNNKSKEVKLYGVRDNIWYYAIGRGNSTFDDVAFEHPAIFPEKLAYDHIITWTNENDIVFDPFMGSGTTAKAAISANRNWIGSEISKEYCEIIEKRLQPLRHNLFT
ncbi:MAG: site-specific DNA-methyltransferase [Candidatus Lokiarchaeota archaeon]|nr:site-specific DNA-methyltransferase [Candidatus Lokiarchaeota archaeon]